MDMDQAAVFLAGSVLTMLGLIVIVAGIVIINNIIHKYWKSFGWSFFPAFLDHGPARFAEPHELDKSKEPKV
jgi:cytochrome b561